MRWLLVGLFLIGFGFLAAVGVYGLVRWIRDPNRQGWKVKGLPFGLLGHDPWEQEDAENARRREQLRPKGPGS